MCMYYICSMCVHKYLYVYVYVHIDIYLFICMYMNTHIQVQVGQYVEKNIYPWVFKYT